MNSTTDNRVNDRFSLGDPLEWIGDERQKQIDKGYDYVHDNSHVRGELVSAAMAYLEDSYGRLGNCAASDIWPFEPHLFKPGTDLDNLIKAAALIVAEIERSMRVVLKTEAPKESNNEVTNQNVSSNSFTEPTPTNPKEKEWPDTSKVEAAEIRLRISLPPEVKLTTWLKVTSAKTGHHVYVPLPIRLIVEIPEEKGGGCVVRGAHGDESTTKENIVDILTALNGIAINSSVTSWALAE